MKITKQYLKQLIREELQLVEAFTDELWAPDPKSEKFKQQWQHQKAKASFTPLYKYAPTKRDFLHLKQLEAQARMMDVHEPHMSGQPRTGGKAVWKQLAAEKRWMHAKQLFGIAGRVLKKFPFIGGVIVGAGLLATAQKAFAEKGAEGVQELLADPDYREEVVEAIANSTGVGSAAVVYKDILDNSGLKLSKQAAFGGPAPEHTRAAGKLGKNCWGNSDKTPDEDILAGHTKVAGFPHCSELAGIEESKSHKG